MNTHNTPTHLENNNLIQVFELDEEHLEQIPISSGWCELGDRGVITVSGEEAESFLQGQLTQDIGLIKNGQSLLGAHCNSKGRILALFRCTYWRNQFFLDLPAELEATALKRLMMYKLRAKVDLRSSTSEIAQTAIWGDAMLKLLLELGWQIPKLPGETAVVSGGLLVCIRPQCWNVIGTVADAAILRNQLAQYSASEPHAWTKVKIKAGLPEVFVATSDTWIPQMLNLDDLQGVSFKKGCYTGQEIVARAHFLGRVKRRMRLFAYHGEHVPIPGQKVKLTGEIGAAMAAHSASSLTESKDDEEESADTIQVVSAVETQTGQGWLLGVTKLLKNSVSAVNDHYK